MKRWLKYLTVAEHPRIVESVRGLSKHEVIKSLGDTNLLSLWGRFCREQVFEDKAQNVFLNPTGGVVECFDSWCDTDVD